MNIKTITMLFTILSLIALAGCRGQQTAHVANELSFSLDGIESLAISYDDEDIRFYESENGNLVVKEYMSKDKRKYHAQVSPKSGEIKISEGGKPIFQDGFVRYIEVYLPTSYDKNLKVTATDGDIYIEDVALNMNSIRIDCTSGVLKLNNAAASTIHMSSTSGTLELGSLAAEQIEIETTDGNVTCAKIEGNVTYASTSGDAEFLSAVGAGSYRATNSGKLSVEYEEVTGNLTLYNKNESINLTLPSDLEFKFNGTTKKGTISTNFQESIAVKGNEASGSIGENPIASVMVETKNGDIKVMR